MDMEYYRLILAGLVCIQAVDNPKYPQPMFRGMYNVVKLLAILDALHA